MLVVCTRVHACVCVPALCPALYPVRIRTCRLPRVAQGLSHAPRAFPPTSQVLYGLLAIRAVASPTRTLDLTQPGLLQDLLTAAASACGKDVSAAAASDAAALYGRVLGELNATSWTEAAGAELAALPLEAVATAARVQYVVQFRGTSAVAGESGRAGGAVAWQGRLLCGRFQAYSISRHAPCAYSWMPAYCVCADLLSHTCRLEGAPSRSPRQDRCDGGGFGNGHPARRQHHHRAARRAGDGRADGLQSDLC